MFLRLNAVSNLVSLSGSWGDNLDLDDLDPCETLLPRREISSLCRRNEEAKLARLARIENLDGKLHSLISSDDGVTALESSAYGRFNDSK